MSPIRAGTDSNVVTGPGASVASHPQVEKAATQPHPGAVVEVSGYDDPDDTDIIDLPGSLVGRLPLRYLDV